MHNHTQSRNVSKLFGPTLILVLMMSLFQQPVRVALALDTQPTQQDMYSGWFGILWADALPGGQLATDASYTLTDENGQVMILEIDPSAFEIVGGLLNLNRRWVNVEGQLSPSGPENTMPVIHVTSISQDGQRLPEAPLAVSGAQPWISIMCMFSDVAAQPKTWSYFQEMFSSAYPGLDHYWREVSYNTINVAGSGAVGWFVLPQPRSYYVYNNQLDHARAATDCTGVANPSVNFANYVGINLMFNAELDGYAWGGGFYLSLDGVSKIWNMTWEPPWGYSDITVMSHEMGHGFGLPHSSGAYGQTYDNQWDIMSDSWSNCGRQSHVTYGCLGQHTNTYHKDLLGWIPATQKHTMEMNTVKTLVLEQVGLPQTSNYKMIRIPIAGSSTHFYTVEARRQTGYDYKLPGQAVIIHEVDTMRVRPAYVVDSDWNGNTGDAGAMWSVGETFSDATNKISVEVIGVTSTGFVVKVKLGDPPAPPSQYDFTGDNVADMSMFRPSDGYYYVRGVGKTLMGVNGDIPVAGDYTGDRKSDIAIFRPSTGTWIINGVGSFVYGKNGDVPVPADYNGDGKLDAAVFRPSNSTWYLRGIGAVVYGASGDIPVPADYTGDGVADIAIFRASSGVWAIRGIGQTAFGANGDIPVPADYTGDGKAEMAVFRPSTGTWVISGASSVVFGASGNIPVPADYTGDGKADLAVFIPATGTWNISGLGTFIYGKNGDVPVLKRPTYPGYPY